MTDQQFRGIVRIANTDLDGNKKIYSAMRKVKGINFMFSNAVLKISNVSHNKKVGELTDDDIKAIEKIIKQPIENGIPTWLVNRRKDVDDGRDKHLVTSELKLRKDFDIKMMQKTKSYKGLRHAAKLPVRGQRTRAHFRRGASVGVQRRSVISSASKKGKK